MTFDEEQELLALEELFNSDFNGGDIVKVSDAIRPGIGDNSELIAKQMQLRGFISDFGALIGREPEFFVTPFAISWYNSLKRKKAAEKLDNKLKRTVGIVAILGTVGTILLAVLSLIQQSEQQSLKREVKQLTAERDSLRQVKNTPRTQQLPKPQTAIKTDTAKSDTALN
jgi:cell division protein FtsB